MPCLPAGDISFVQPSYGKHGHVTALAKVRSETERLVVQVGRLNLGDYDPTEIGEFRPCFSHECF